MQLVHRERHLLLINMVRHLIHHAIAIGLGIRERTILRQRRRQRGVHLEPELAACQVLERLLALAVSTGMVLQTIQLCGIHDADGYIQVGLRHHNGIALDIPADLRLLGLVPTLQADVAALEEDIVVEGVAVEHLAHIATLETELLVEFHEATEELYLHAGFTREIVRIGHTTFQHTANARIEEIQLLLEEAEVDFQAKLGIEVGIELSLAIPTVDTRSLAKVHTRIVALEVTDRDVEARRRTHVAIEEAEVHIYITPYRGTEHHATTGLRIGQEVVARLGAGVVGLRDVVALHTTLLSTVEEPSYLFGYRGQLPVIGQLIAQTEVGVGTDGHRNDFRFKVDERKLTTLVVVGLTKVEVPLGRTTWLLVADIKIKAHLERRTAKRCAIVALVLVFGLLFLIGGHVFFVILILLLALVAHSALEALLSCLLDFFELSCDSIHLALHFGERTIELVHNLLELATVESSIHGEVELEVAFLFVVLIDELDLTLDDATDRRHRTIEQERGERLLLGVEGNGQVEAALDGLTIARRDAHTEDKTNRTLARTRIELVARVIDAVDVETSTNVVEGHWRHGDTHLATHHHVEEAPGEVVALLLVVEVTALDVHLEDAALDLAGQFSLVALVRSTDASRVAIDRQHALEGEHGCLDVESGLAEFQVLIL